MKMFSLKVLVSVLLILGGIGMAAAQQAPPILQAGQTITPVGPQAQVPGPPPPGETPPGPVPTPSPPGQVPPPPQGQVLTPPGAPGNAPRAIETAKQADKYFTPGKIWMYRAPGGEIVIKAAVVYQGVAVTALEFNPSDGTILPRGYHPRVFNGAVPLEQIKQKLPGIISTLRVLNGAEYREPEHSWAIPLVYNGKIVAHVRVYYDAIHIVPDYPATQEMEACGQ